MRESWLYYSHSDRLVVPPLAVALEVCTMDILRSRNERTPTELCGTMLNLAKNHRDLRAHLVMLMCCMGQ